MVFSSQLFVFWFLPAALAVYYALPRRARHLGLTVSSYLFYGWTNPLFMVLMATSTVIDYLCGLAMAGRLGRRFGQPIERLEPGAPRSRGQRLAVTVSVVANLGLLGFFKYFNFAADSYNALLAGLGLGELRLDSVLRVALPLGISFYTFQSMSYSIDVYRGRSRALRNFVDFACYVSLFPQLVAGPIIRFSEIADQLRSRTHSFEKVARGAAFFGLGMAKKVLLANPCGKVADTVFDAGSVLAPDAWFGAVAYAFQIYFDFSGYSDMAIGLGLMLGFVFPKNFDSPYRAESITEFWRRWHISLSTWLRDYLYLPLGGNRRGAGRTYVNLALVMLLGGLWHGAAWNFVVWGGLHGVLLAAERARGKRSLFAGLPRPLRVGGTFFLVLVSWVLFRAADLPAAGRYLAAMVGLGAPQGGAWLAAGIVYQPYYLLTTAVAALVVWAAPQSWDWTRRLPAWKVAACLALFWLSLAALTTQEYNPFIYFIF
ncbi:MAG: MBOAT family protein [Acidobacteriota bacterium]|nr:MBOAT family protein [Acidobacteriota bacterium]MDH3523693.1 MBOAT family protein [Acidobacteriota bacterium]